MPYQSGNYSPHAIRTAFFVALLGGLIALTTAGCGPEADEDNSVTLVPGGADTGTGPKNGPETGASTGDDTGDSQGSTPDSSAPTTDTAPSPGPDTGRTTSPPADTGVLPPDTTSPPADTGADTSATETCNGTRRMCDGVCTELLSNPDACGSCDNQCSPGATCLNGICNCAKGMKKCGGTCVDPTSNDDHCFTCGNACPNGEMCQNSVCVEANPKAAVLKYTNQARTTPTDCGTYGVKPPGPPLTRNAELDKAAQAHAEAMAMHDFFAHVDPTDGSTYQQRVARTNYQGRVIHENIARGLRMSAKRIVQGWIGSDNHCRGLANPKAEEIGIGYVKLQMPNGRWDSYWVQEFGIQ